MENNLSFDYNEDLYYIYSEHNKDDKGEKVLKELLEETINMSLEEFKKIYNIENGDYKEFINDQSETGRANLKRSK